MFEVVVLSSKGYENADERNYGDCFLINTGSELIIYDCGSETHALRVMDYMERYGYSEAICVLSHNDSDHFDGIPMLLERKKISKIYTTLLLKYKEDILERIDDKRKTKDSVARQITELYDNIASLTGAPIVDIYEESAELCNEVTIVGSDKDYMLDAVAKRLDGREGDTVDGETAVNATSIQLSISISGHKLLLCGDSSYAAIEDKLLNYDAIQLPHHGKPKQAEKIFDKMISKVNTLYIVSDNTGASNGGSDQLNTKGHRVRNTKTGSDIRLDQYTFASTTYRTLNNLGR